MTLILSFLQHSTDVEMVSVGTMTFIKYMDNGQRTFGIPFCKTLVALFYVEMIIIDTTLN